MGSGALSESVGAAGAYSPLCLSLPPSTYNIVAGQFHQLQTVPVQMAGIPTDEGKLERMKKRMAKECAAQASQKYRERNRNKYNEKARARMAQNRQRLSEEAIQRRRDKARERYQRNRSTILEKAKKKRIEAYIARHGTEGFQKTYRPRDVVPLHLLSLKSKDPAQFNTEKVKWKKQLLTNRFFARKQAKHGRKWY
ncbi:hypothetical protein V5O48_013743 [Marasmius crinis-equi]|uniref:Uncharacterized protein n=1 Tax=Marasmius crinis-equi TaxID=585013 RepID=A0ABR3EZ84_9AGAR